MDVNDFDIFLIDVTFYPLCLKAGIYCAEKKMKREYYRDRQLKIIYQSVIKIFNLFHPQ